MSPSFVDLGVPSDLVRVLADRGATHPFPVQAATLPDALAGRDVCGKAPTGSGKTLAFGIATVVATDRARPNQPHALILVPTRELANQVRDELRPMADARDLTVAAVFGGTGYEKQLRALRKGVDIMVACPGRLEDLLQRGDVDLSRVTMLVVDEADRMADMGFLPAVKRIADLTSSDRQTLLFSATLDGDVDVLVKRYQHKPRRHEVVSSEDKQGDVDHRFWKVEREERVEVAAQLVDRHWPAIVFSRTKHGADRLTRQLKKAGVDAVPIHGNRSQGQRERALAEFTDGRAQALVATDVAARGIHVDNVGLVIHFDPPATDKDYVHRSGRTGRAGADGLVVSLVTPDKAGAVKLLQRDLQMHHGLEPVDDDVLDGGERRPRPPRQEPTAGKSSSNNGGSNGSARNGRTGNAQGGRGDQNEDRKPKKPRKGPKNRARNRPAKGAPSKGQANHRGGRPKAKASSGSGGGSGSGGAKRSSSKSRSGSTSGPERSRRR
ncbi:MAG: DEAD/DEAH box helicase [Actinomycetia bacterium]|nr:DEAD/DEAH box helicase [Actinomycetes bacterium]